MELKTETCSHNDLRLIEIEDQNIQKQKNILKDLYDIWNKVGVDDKQLENRGNSVWTHVNNLLTEILEEERGYYEDIKERIKNYQDKISELSSVLSLPKVADIEGTLLMQERALRQELDKLSKLKHKRIKEFKDLQTDELKYCKILGMPPLNLSSNTGVPSEKDLSELQQHLKLLKQEKNDRHKKFCHLKKELTTILEVTEITPETSLQKEILTSKEDCLSLSNETFKLLEQMVIKIKHQKTDMENKKKILLDKLVLLWDRLKISETDRKVFLSKYTECRVSTLKAIEQEINRCEEIKKQNMKKYIDSLKEELLSLWEKCFISESEKQNFSQIYADVINEDILEAFDNKVSILRKYYSEIENIVTKIHKRNELMKLMIALENKATDPNRFKNRRGNLLKEERERKKIQKDLPALENEIFLDIERYEEYFGKTFLYFGEDFRVFVTRQWDERNAQKENEKLMRQKLRTQQIENELTVGTTPSKRQLPLTPKSAPSKLFKSTFGVPIYRTPNITCSRPIPNTIAKLKSSMQIKLNKSKGKSNVKVDGKNILKEKNQKSSDSNSANTTTYTDFADKLNRSSRYAHRSSAVLTSKKVVGTRLSQSKSQRKSVSKSMQKSIKKTNTSRITPVRGKLGLPIII